MVSSQDDEMEGRLEIQLLRLKASKRDEFGGEVKGYRDSMREILVGRVQLPVFVCRPQLSMIFFCVVLVVVALLQ